MANLRIEERPLTCAHPQPDAAELGIAGANINDPRWAEADVAADADGVFVPGLFARLPVEIGADQTYVPSAMLGPRFSAMPTRRR